MDETKRQRRFQLSVRKLRLWMAVVAAYLGVMWLTGIDVVAAMIATPGLAVFVVIRLKWGSHRGFRIAVGGTAIGLTALIATWIANGHWVGRGVTLTGSQVIGLGWELSLILALGTGAALLAFTAVDLVVRVVDWLDNVMQTRTPQATDNHDNQTPPPDAASTEE